MSSKKLLLIFLILATAAVIILSVNFGPAIPNPFVRTETRASSSLILKQIRDISRLNTIELIYKTVFPFDLIAPDTDMAAIIKKYNSGKLLNHSEAEALSLYGIAAEAGLDVNGTSFAVVTVHVKAGYDFPEPLPESSIILDEEADRVSIRLPAVKITEVIIEDDDSSIYSYPDLNVSPEHWKLLTSILSDWIEKEAESRGIFQKANERGRQVITRLLKNSGFSEVIFID